MPHTATAKVFMMPMMVARMCDDLEVYSMKV